MFHIGRRIKEVFAARPKAYDIAWFAGRLNCKRANIYNIFSRSTLDTQLLMQISLILEHDFFRDLSNDLLQSGGAGFNEKQQICDDIMSCARRLQALQLEPTALPGAAAGGESASIESVTQ